MVDLEPRGDQEMNILLSPVSLAVRALFWMYGVSEPLARTVAAIVVPIALRPLRARRRANFQAFFGALAPEGLERRYVRYHLELIAASVSLRAIPPAELKKQTVIEGEEHLREALRAGGGAILLMSHAGFPGNAVAAVTAAGYPVSHISNRLPLQAVNGLIAEVAGQYGAEILWRSASTAAQVREALGRNRLVVALYDVVVREKNVEQVPFGKGTIPADLGTPVIALRSAVPVLPVTHRRENGRWRIMVGAPLTLSVSGDPRADARRAMALWMRQLEKEIANRPEEWWPWSFVRLGSRSSGA